MLLQAVSPVDERVAWVGGHRGTWARTLNGGETWETGVVPGAERLQFRDVHAAGADTAWLLSAGSGELSRIYRTVDGGLSWELQFLNREPEGFYDCFDFWSPTHGVAYGDAVGGELRILLTTDGVRWSLVAPGALPPALEREGGFAASGTCVVTRSGGHAWIGTGAGATARVLRTADGGRRWRVAETPIVSGEAAGITTLAFRDLRHGIALGGDLQDPDGHAPNVAVTRDGGRSWALAARPTMPGAVYGSAYVPGAPTPTVVAVGPKGAELSRDEAESWVPLDTAAYWAVGFASPRAGWLVGPGGRITRVGFF